MSVCVSCGRNATKENPLTKDHIIPKSKGGTDDKSNIQMLCLECNQIKANQTTFTALYLRRMAEWYVMRHCEDDFDTRHTIIKFVEYMEKQQGGII